MNYQLIWLCRPRAGNKKGHSYISMLGSINHANEFNTVDDESQIINIGSHTDYLFEPVIHGIPTHRFNAEELKKYLSNAHINFSGESVDEIFDIMNVVKAALDGYSEEITGFIKGDKTSFEHPPEADLGFKPEVLENIKEEIGNLNAVMFWGYYWTSDAKKKTQEALDALKYPAAEKLIKAVFIENSLGLE